MSAAVSRPAGIETRRAILDAALDLFSERSFDGAATRAIAELAGVTQPLLNYHFAGKEELRRAAVDALYENAVAMVERLAARGELAPVPPAHLYYRVTGAGASVFVMAPECQRLTGVDPFAPEFVAAHADLVVDLLIRAT